ncbi:MAG: glycosyltransferase [Elusimicrobiota bacterium]
MKQLTILHIDFEKTWRGGQQQLFWLVEGLNIKGHSNFVICSPKSALHQKLAENIPFRDNFFTVQMLFELDPIAIYKTTKIIDKIKPDIIHLHSAHAHTIGLLASKICSCLPTVLSQGDKTSRWGQVIYQAKMFHHKPKIVSSRRVDFHIKSKLKYNNVDKIIAVSNGVKKVLLEDGISNEKISVVHSGVDLSRFENVCGDELYEELKIKKEYKIVGIVASLAPHKDHKNFLTAAVLIKEKIPEIKFLIVGDGELKNKLIKLAGKLGIADSVIFTGFRKDVPQLLAIFDVFVLSSHLEGLCTSVIDAMVSGIPIVATDVGGVGELVEDGVNGFLVLPRNPEILAEKTVGLLTDKNLQQKFSQNSKIKSKNFSKEKMIEGTEKLYLEMTTANNPEGVTLL